MKVLMRKTISGNEYWDTEAKRTLFVPKGSKPDFEVDDNPKSLVGGVDLASGRDVTVVDGMEVVDLDSMDTEQLLAFAKEHDIDVPGNMKKTDTIRNHIKKENLVVSDEQ